MNVSRDPFDDRSEPDANGIYDYIYVGAYYTFCEGKHELRFAIYEDEPYEASLKRPIYWAPDVYASELFRQAVEYLRCNEAVRTITVCDPRGRRGFIPIAEAVDLARAAGLPVPDRLCL